MYAKKIISVALGGLLFLQCPCDSRISALGPLNRTGTAKTNFPKLKCIPILGVGGLTLSAFGYLVYKCLHPSVTSQVDGDTNLNSKPQNRVVGQDEEPLKEPNITDNVNSSILSDNGFGIENNGVITPISKESPKMTKIDNDNNEELQDTSKTNSVDDANCCTNMEQSKKLDDEFKDFVKDNVKDIDIYPTDALPENDKVHPGKIYDVRKEVNGKDEEFDINASLVHDYFANDKGNNVDPQNCWITPFYQFLGNLNAERGWKIHIEPKVSKCKKVLELLFKFREAHKGSLNFDFKFVYSLPIYRYLNKDGEGKGQTGKFITIYPNSDEQANEIVSGLHRLFQENGLTDDCFLKSKKEFQIYPGIYTRLCHYNDREDANSRKYLGIPLYVFRSHIGNLKQKSETYTHPFEKLTVDGVTMPKLVSNINRFLLDNNLIYHDDSSETNTVKEYLNSI